MFTICFEKVVKKIRKLGEPDEDKVADAKEKVRKKAPGTNERFCVFKSTCVLCAHYWTLVSFWHIYRPGKDLACI